MTSARTTPASSAPASRWPRSDDYAFANDLVTFRAQIRLDGALGGGGSDAVKHFIGNAA